MMAEPNHVQASQEQEPIIPKTEPVEEELDASLDADIDMAGTQQPSSMNMDGGGDDNTATAAAAPAELDAVESAVEAKTVGKKDATLREFMGKMDEYAPIVRL